MPSVSEAEVKLSEQLTDFKLSTEHRFGLLERELGEIKTEIRLTSRRLGWLIGALVILGAGSVGSVIRATSYLAWQASAVVAQVQQHGTRLDKLDAKLEQYGTRLDRLDTKLESMDRRFEHMDAKLDTLLSRTQPK